MTGTPPPRATYRLQLNKDFTFADATAVVDYLAALGISHLYVSPFLKARPGSTHGYDITDHEALNPEIGTDEDFARLTAALAARGMGLILDFVPNHMGVGSQDNGWWLDVLEWGQASPYAEYFDIDWEARRSDLHGKVLLPVLGDQYGSVLEKGEIALCFDATDGSFGACYYDHRFPIAPRVYGDILSRVAAVEGEAGETLRRRAEAFSRLDPARSRQGRRTLHDEGLQLKASLAALVAEQPALIPLLEQAASSFSGEPGMAASWRRLHLLLDVQAYRLAYWRAASDEINYRRFFNINDLAGIRIELPALFARAHRRVLELIAAGQLQGLRIDHIDGLFDPDEYCERLQNAASAAAQVPAGGFYITVEKILAAYEGLREWPIAGTTGYDFINELGGLFVDPSGEELLTQIYAGFTGRNANFDGVLYQSKKRITDVNLASEVNVLGRAFHALSITHLRSRDFTVNGMRKALDEVLASFPVYRTYVTPKGAGADDRRYIDWAIGQAKKRWPGTDTSIFDFIRGVLNGDLAARGSGYNRAAVLRLAMKFQQLSGPVMAKGAEDTAFYRYARLIAINEVGGDPRRFGVSVAAFHRICELRAKRWPAAMLASTTHDTKRAEDARARLVLLSELPREWDEHLTLWARLNRLRRGEVDGEPAPDANDEYIFYQTVLGAWPPDLAVTDVDGVAAFAERVQGTMVKVVREAKERSSWSNPNADYEAVLGRFIAGALDASRPNPFLQDMQGFVERLARPGTINSLAQTLVKLTAPGVPDTYQGAELWDFSMVDPDNRRPVDWAQRRRLLDETGDGADPARLAAEWRDGREKLFLLRRVLTLRVAEPALFAEGSYMPLEVTGRHADRLCVFARGHEGKILVTIVPRLVVPPADGTTIDWGDTAVVLPDATRWRDVLSNCDLGAVADPTAAARFADFPVALLIGT